MTFYPQHIATLQKRYRAAMSAFNLDTVILSSGHKTYYFQDDHSHSFKAYSGAQQWLPFKLDTDIHIIIAKHGNPTLLWPIKEDFWHAANLFPEGDWQNEWDVIDKPIEHCLTHHFTGQSAWLGPKRKETILSAQFIEPQIQQKLEAFLNYEKAYKTEYEIEAIQQANIHAVAGHRAAEQAFLDNKSELAIYHDYLNASHQDSTQEPYPGIIALDTNAAVLHYEKKQFKHEGQSNTLLIDAGATVHGYASDITRTYTKDNGLFKDLLVNMDELQQQLCEKAVAGIEFKQLHNETLKGIGNILYQHKICSLSVDEQIQKGVVQTFFPHGLGHLLGLQVHDLGGHQIDQQGHLQRPSSDAPFLRLTRTLEENMVITIEPGLYFIPMLIAKMQHQIPQHGCDLDKIDALLPFGGIRIEDNVVVKKDNSRNLTREAFAL